MAMAKITLSFGLISFAAKLDKATETPIEMKNLCVGSNGEPTHDPRPLTAPRQCADCGEITDYSGIVKGIKQGSSYAIVTQQDVADARTSNATAYKGLVSLVPHPAADFERHTAPGESLYYIHPDSTSADHYQLLVHLIESHPELSFVSLYTPRTAAGLYRVIVRDGVLVLESRVRGQAVKAAPSIGGTSNPALYAMLDSILATLVQPYDADNYEDGYAAAITALAAAASDVVDLSTGKKGATVTALPTSISDDDIMAKLAAMAASTEQVAS